MAAASWLFPWAGINVDVSGWSPSFHRQSMVLFIGIQVTMLLLPFTVTRKAYLAGTMEQEQGEGDKENEEGKAASRVKDSYEGGIGECTGILSGPVLLAAKAF